MGLLRLCRPLKPKNLILNRKPSLNPKPQTLLSDFFQDIKKPPGLEPTWLLSRSAFAIRSLDLSWPPCPCGRRGGPNTSLKVSKERMKLPLTRTWGYEVAEQWVGNITLTRILNPESEPPNPDAPKPRTPRTQDAEESQKRCLHPCESLQWRPLRCSTGSGKI